MSCAWACEQGAHQDPPCLTSALRSPLCRWGSAGGAKQAHTILKLQRLQAHCFLATSFWAIWWCGRRAFVAGHRWRQVVVWRGLHAAEAESAGWLSVRQWLVIIQVPKRVFVVLLFEALRSMLRRMTLQDGSVCARSLAGVTRVQEEFTMPQLNMYDLMRFLL